MLHVCVLVTGILLLVLAVCFSFFLFSVFCFLLYCFFFQAEDGIRDLVRSRGLGDVYKRQFCFNCSNPSCANRPLRGPSNTNGKVIIPTVKMSNSRAILANIGAAPVPVSYTHLTLPTSDLV